MADRIEFEFVPYGNVGWVMFRRRCNGWTTCRGFAGPNGQETPSFDCPDGYPLTADERIILADAVLTVGEGWTKSVYALDASDPDGDPLADA